MGKTKKTLLLNQLISDQIKDKKCRNATKPGFQRFNQELI